ncbi:MAG: LuxR C-terminal-related transcriptional regulator, partial [Acidobacteriaceae bacterium]
AASQCFHRYGVDIDEVTRLPLRAQKSSMIPLSLVKLLVVQKQNTAALRIIEALVKQLESQQFMHYLISVLIWQALALHALNQETQALAAFKRALSLAEPEGYKRTFINMGPRLIPLLQLAEAARVRPEYVATLSALVKIGGKKPLVKEVPAHALVEPLSVREMDVLRLLAQGFPDKKIAESLVIARETVHKHLKNIYGKLDVHSRSEAIARAREAGLL